MHIGRPGFVTHIIEILANLRIYYIHATRCTLASYKHIETQLIGTYSIKREKVMQNQKYVRQSNGAKAIALDTRAELVKTRLLQLMAVIFTAAVAGGLRLIFIH